MLHRQMFVAPYTEGCGLSFHTKAVSEASMAYSAPYQGRLLFSIKLNNGLMPRYSWYNFSQLDGLWIVSPFFLPFPYNVWWYQGFQICVRYRDWRYVSCQGKPCSVICLFISCQAYMPRHPADLDLIAIAHQGV